MICFYLSYRVIPSIGTLKVFLTAVAFAAACLGIVWMLRAVFGRRTGRVAAYVILSILAAIVIWYPVQCGIEMAVPPRYEGNVAFHNNGAIRSLMYGGALILPAIFLAVASLGLSDWLFFRAPKRLNNV